MSAVEFGDERLPPRFWSKVAIDAKSGCWLWTGSQAPGGYGHFWLGKLRLCNRLVVEELVAPIPPNSNVCHRCDNPPCCNPDHLWVGTQGDNIRDMVAKGRQVKRPWKKVCKRGHRRTPDNLIGNECRKCRQYRQRVEYSKEKD